MKVGRKLRKEYGLKTALTALVSAITGGMVATLLVYLGGLGLGESPGRVTINGAPPATPGDPGGEESSSVRDVYTRDGPGVVTIDVGSRESGPGGGSGFV